MNYELAVFSYLIQIFLIYYQIKNWRLRVVFSPGFFFAVIWSFGLLGCLILEPVGLLFSPYPEYIDELNILVSFTSICFILFTKKGLDKVERSPVVSVRFCSDKSYKILAVFFLFAALADFVRLGGNFNVGGAREHLAMILSSRPVWIGYIQLLSLPLSVYAGTRLCSILQGESRSLSYKMFLVLPLVGNLIFSMNVGGRVDFVYSVTQYLLGFAIHVPFKQSFRQYVRYLKPLFLVGISLVFFITLVGHLRSSHHNVTSEKEQYIQSQNPVLATMYGPIEYILSSYAGYQLRRVDAVDKNKLGYGRYTFNGFINWTLPFSGQLGLADFSIAKQFGIYYNNQETYDYERELYYTTHSGYIPIIKDFGFYGAFICIFFLTFIAHHLFVSLQTKKVLRYACQLFFFFLFWQYWVKMNFYGTLSSSVLLPLYSFIIVDIVNKFYKRKVTR